jgi:SAM domain (Sterile alpha motif)
MTISIKNFDNQEVCIWLNAIGLGSKVGPFQDNAVDGDLLCSLSQEDLTNDLGLSGLQVRTGIVEPCPHSHVRFTL